MSAAVLEGEAIRIPTLYKRDFDAMEALRCGRGAIYGLYDPLTGELRYVGQTCTTLIARLREHFRVCGKGKYHAARWVRSLLRKGLVPRIEILEVVDFADLNSKEIQWIAATRESGCRLTNDCDGGYGQRGRKQSVEERERRGTAIREAYWSDPSKQQRRRESSKGRRPPVRSGEANANAVLSELDVIWIRQETKTGRSASDVARELNRENSSVANAAFGRTWHYLDDIESPAPSRSRRRSPDNQIDIEGIRSALARNEKGRDIAQRFGVSFSYVSQIKRGRLHPLVGSSDTI